MPRRKGTKTLFAPRERGSPSPCPPARWPWPRSSDSGWSYTKDVSRWECRSR